MALSTFILLCNYHHASHNFFIFPNWILILFGSCLEFHCVDIPYFIEPAYIDGYLECPSVCYYIAKVNNHTCTCVHPHTLFGLCALRSKCISHFDKYFQLPFIEIVCLSLHTLMQCVICIMTFASLDGKWHLGVVLFYISCILNDIKFLLKCEVPFVFIFCFVNHFHILCLIF